MNKTCLAIVFVFITGRILAQTNSNAPIHKEYRPALYQVSPRLDIVLNKSNVNIYLEGLYNTNAIYASFIEQTRWNVKPGVDWGITDKWYVGLSERVNMNSSGIYNYTTRAYIQHRGNIGKILFLKELIYEQFNFVDRTLANTSGGTTTLSRRPAEGRFGIGLGIGRYIPVAENHIAVFLSYRPNIQFDFIQDGIAYFNKRFIDYTNLRIDAGYLIKKSLYVGLYASRDTNYSYVPASDPYRSNSITPIYGIVCNILLFVDEQAEKELKSFRYFYTK